MTDDYLFYPNVDLGEFRYTAARYVKLLIRARWKAEPGFIAADELNHWGLGNIADDPDPGWRLLEQAGANLGDLNQHFIERCGSGGIGISDDSSPAANLAQDIGLSSVFRGRGAISQSSPS